MNQTSFDLERRLQSFVNRGIVTQVDHARACCRVKIDGLETDWLAFASPRMGKVKIWNPPSVGEQVLVISETGELATGLVITSFDYANCPMPSENPDTVEMHCPDGAAFIYDQSTHALTVSLPDDSITKIASSHIQLSATDVDITCANYRVACDSYAVNCGSYSLNSASNYQNGKLIINGQPYLDHNHGGIKSGPSNTGGVNA